MNAYPSAAFAARAHRLIASRYPVTGIFDDIAGGNEDDLRAAFELEALTDDRNTAADRLRFIPGGEIAPGKPGVSMVMAAFLYSAPTGGRFTDHRLGAWYAATDIATAIEETVYHHERRLRASAAGFPNRIQMGELLSDLDATFLDLRGRQSSDTGLYHPTDYAASQAFAAARRWPFAQPGEAGFVYDSVRNPRGTNVCVFRPNAVGLPLIQGARYEYVWDAGGGLDVLGLTDVTRRTL